jgi:hypothetical protein
MSADLRHQAALERERARMRAAVEPEAVETRRRLLLGLGAFVVLVSALADVLGIGGEPGFG